MTRLRIGPIQAAALGTYIFDVAVNGTCGDPAFPGALDGNTLTVTDRDLAWRLLTEAANSCADDGDREWCEALTAVSGRVLRAAG